MKLLFLNGSRGEWGYIQPLVDICRDQSIDYTICATNMVLLPGYGSLIKDIRAQGYEVCDEIFMSLEGHNHTTMAKSLAVFMTSFVDTLRREKPDWVILSGDRGEQLMGAIACAYTYTPVAHIQAGELSGNIDGVSRHAIGKFAHLHFAANADAAERLQKLGEEDFRIHNVGHPALDPIAKGCVSDPAELKKHHGLNSEAPYFLVVLHPVTEDYEQADTQAAALMEALGQFEQEKIWILSNNDAGASRVRDHVLRHRTADIHLFENLPREDFLGFMKGAQCMVGNSSAGLLEAPTFHLPAINIGRRQHRRVQGQNVINTLFEPAAISAAIRQGCDPVFHQSLTTTTNPYGDGHSAEKIISVLKQTQADDQLLIKRLTY
jgi:GDP/UDP-N,N'-diacetylbacillosamine 2-epimerase (hydrolysing)